MLNVCVSVMVWNSLIIFWFLVFGIKIHARDSEKKPWNGKIGIKDGIKWSNKHDLSACYKQVSCLFGRLILCILVKLINLSICLPYTQNTKQIDFRGEIYTKIKQLKNHQINSQNACLSVANKLISFELK